MSIKKKSSLFAKALAVVGPGLFLIGYNIGTGSVTTMASAGSRWGLSLTWVILLSCVFTFICIWAFSKYTLVTGETILYAVKSRFRYGKPISFFILCSIIFAEFMGITGLTVIITDLINEWGQQLGLISGRAAKSTISVILAAVLIIILWRGNTRRWKKFFHRRLGWGWSIKSDSDYIDCPWLFSDYNNKGVDPKSREYQ